MPDCTFTIRGASSDPARRDDQYSIRMEPPLAYPCTQIVRINNIAVKPGGEEGGFRIVQAGGDGSLTLRALSDGATATLSIVRKCPAKEDQPQCERAESVTLGSELPSDPWYIQLLQTIGLPVTAATWSVICLFIMLWGLAGIPFTGTRHLREACRLCKQLTNWIPDWLKKRFR